MRQITVLILTGLMSIGLLQAQEFNQVDDQGRKQGAWRKFHEGTQVLFYEGNFKDDAPIGLFKYYYDKGVIKGLMDYGQGGTNVYNQTYHPNGKLMAEGKYIEQKKDSVWTYYDEQGILSSKEHWDRGAKHGEEEVYFDNGAVSELTTHVDGLREGPWKQFYENGQVKVDGTFVQDKFHGPISYYFDNGSKEVTGTYNQGVRTATWMYFNQDGTVRYQAVYRGGKKMKERFENGTFDTYGQDNVVLETITYKNGVKEGPFMEFHDDAQFSLEPVTDPRTGETYQREVKTGNELKRSGEYVNDQLHGEVSYYNALGRKIKTETYIKGELQ